MMQVVGSSGENSHIVEPSIPDVYGQKLEGAVAATKIQSVFRGYKERKEI